MIRFHFGFVFMLCIAQHALGEEQTTCPVIDEFLGYRVERSATYIHPPTAPEEEKWEAMRGLAEEAKDSCSDMTLLTAAREEAYPEDEDDCEQANTSLECQYDSVVEATGCQEVFCYVQDCRYLDRDRQVADCWVEVTSGDPFGEHGTYPIPEHIFSLPKGLECKEYVKGGCSHLKGSNLSKSNFSRTGGPLGGTFTGMRCTSVGRVGVQQWCEPQVDVGLFTKDRSK